MQRYLEELRRIASNVGRIEKRTQEQMRRAPILLGSRRGMLDNAKATADGSDDEDDTNLEHQLLRPSEVLSFAYSAVLESNLSFLTDCYR